MWVRIPPTLTVQIYYMGDVITVKNKLEIKPGNIIQIPGCEPTSDLTSVSLSRNLRCYCKSAIIDAKKAQCLIPGSKIVRVMMPLGHLSTGFFLELPEGPPQNSKCPVDCIPDWYAILRAHATIEEPEKPECEGFDYSGCVKDYDVLKVTRDPNMRPNQNPLDSPFDHFSESHV